MWGRVDWVGNYDGVKTFLNRPVSTFFKKRGFFPGFFSTSFWGWFWTTLGRFSEFYAEKQVKNEGFLGILQLWL
jgi:hypothetical protein